MIFREFVNLFTRRKAYWIIITLLWCLFLFESSPFIDPTTGADGTIWDFMVNILLKKFIHTMLFPIFYFCLIADLITRDFKHNYIGFLMSRVKRRSTWFFAKIITLFSAAFVLIAWLGAMSLIAGILKGLTFTNSFHGSYAHCFTNHIDQIPIFWIAFLLVFYIIGLTSLGVLLIVFSLFYPNTIVIWGLGILLCVLAWGAYPWNMALAVWLPSARLNFGAYFFAEEPSELFGLGESLWFFFIIIIVALICGLLQVCRMNLSK